VTTIEPRTAKILEAVVREFITTGEPVSSGRLYERYDFGIKPAMIRLVLKDLDRGGYLAQPNYSAGRIPSDKGYQFFARYVLAAAEPAEQENQDLFDSFWRHAWTDALDLLSARIGTLSVASPLHNEEVYKSGLERLVASFDWHSRAEIMSVIRDFEELDDRIRAAKPGLIGEGDVQVFVGRESPVTRCDYLAVMASECNMGDERVLICAIGPKRMNYQRAAKVLKGLRTNKTKNQRHGGRKSS
jgi:transcriptional regulator of heat shock response